MHQIHAHKVPVDRLDAYLAGLRQQVRRSARTLRLVQVVYSLAILVLFLVLGVLINVGVLIAIFFVLFFTWGIPSGRARTHELLQRRLIWLDALLRRLRDDLAPTEKLRVRYDLQPSDSWLHKVKTTKSSAGNTKAYYRSRWLRVRGMLADGTRFRIRVQSAVKHKKGQTLREQSTLILEVTPAGRDASATGTAADSPAETRPWGPGSVTIEPAHGRQVFRFQAHESDLLDLLYRALRYAVALVPGQPDANPAPGSPA